MIKVRMYAVKNRVTTAQVLEHRAKTNLSMQNAKAWLENAEAPRLQYYDVDTFDSKAGTWGCWVDVPHVTEYRGVPDESF